MLGCYVLKNMCLDLQRQTLCYVLHTPDKTAFKILPLLGDLSEKIRDGKGGFMCNSEALTGIKYDSDSCLETQNKYW